MNFGMPRVQQFMPGVLHGPHQGNASGANSGIYEVALATFVFIGSLFLLPAQMALGNRVVFSSGMGLMSYLFAKIAFRSSSAGYHHTGRQYSYVRYNPLPYLNPVRYIPRTKKWFSGFPPMGPSSPRHQVGGLPPLRQHPQFGTNRHHQVLNNGTGIVRQNQRGINPNTGIVRQGNDRHRP